MLGALTLDLPDLIFNFEFEKKPNEMVVELIKFYFMKVKKKNIFGVL